MKYRNGGFTVIELMIVVAIIALLAVALLPNLVGARNSSNDAAITAVLTRAAQAEEMYYTRCDNYYVDNSNTCKSGENASDVWTKRVAFKSPTNVAVSFKPPENGADITANYCVQAYHTSDPSRIFKVTLGNSPILGACGS